MKQEKRPVDLVVILDVHLGTYGCRAKELLIYLKSIQPKRIILNGDIIDIWLFSKRYWPKSHMQVVRQILEFVGQGIPVDYITGNHDEMLRKFVGFELGSFRITNKVLMEHGGKRMWFFHGDVFDVTMQHSKWLARLGAIGYDTLILINTFMNWTLEKMGRERYSLSKRVKNSVKGAVSFINNFEQTAANIAIENGYDYVCCGHIHQPEKRIITNDQGSVTYLNSGDWIENLTSLEYHQGEWKIYEFGKQNISRKAVFEIIDKVDMNSSQLFKELVQEFEGLRKTNHSEEGDWRSEAS